MAAVVFASLWLIPLDAEPQSSTHKQTSGQHCKLTDWLYLVVWAERTGFQWTFTFIGKEAQCVCSYFTDIQLEEPNLWNLTLRSYLLLVAPGPQTAPWPAPRGRTPACPPRPPAPPPAPSDQLPSRRQALKTLDKKMEFTSFFKQKSSLCIMLLV